MTQLQQQNAAKKFSESWAVRGYEKGESQKFWLDLLCNVFGVQDFTNFIFFEEQVKDKIQNKTITNFIDAYIPQTRVMIEQKSSHKDLREPIKQSDGSLLTPFQQAKKYVADLPLSQHPRWIVACNFDEFLIYDMEQPNGEPQQIFLNDLEKDYYRLEFLVDSKNENLKKEEEISLKAGDLVGKLYDSLYKQYLDPDANSLKSLNILCVRIVFCLYAEDAGLFESKTSFEDYIKSFAIENLRAGIIGLFKALDTKIEKRDKYDTKLKPFPYVNGGLFRDEQIEIPNFSQEIVDVIIKQCAPFNWSEISPTIFGAVFESTLNPETRRKGGMHYTSIQNIHKVIDPLFLNDLKAELEEIKQINIHKERLNAIKEFQTKISNLKFLDPACGSGNFLTESYLSLARLEIEALKATIDKNEMALVQGQTKVSISQFYGIEINDFAVTVAKTALWISESQVLNEINEILQTKKDFLPLTTNAFIVEGNALCMNWSTLKAENKQEEDTLFTGFTTQTDGTEHLYDYIMGNPPFIGYSFQNEEQKKDVLSIYVDKNGKSYSMAGKIDYVSCWYYKASQLIQGTNTRCAFVSTNSICQGDQVCSVWKPLYDLFNIHIDFAYRTFQWDSEASIKAHVHCVIIGFSYHDSDKKTIFLNDEQKIEAKNINGYLLDGENIFIQNCSKPISKNVPEARSGNKPIDGGYYLFTEEEMLEFVKKEPKSKKYFKKWIGADEFINGYVRYCLWLGDCSPSELRIMPECLKRVEAVRQFRLASKSEGTRKLADKQTRFHVETFPTKPFLVMPLTSSEKRRYVPIGYLQPDTLASNLVVVVADAELWHFGIVTSNVFMAWMRAVCGRLETRYRITKDNVYNNFPWPNPGPEQKAKIEQTAQAILDARAKYPGSSLADLYDETVMPADLRAAHRENDKAVMQAYGFKLKMTESEVVADLFKLYEELVK